MLQSYIHLRTLFCALIRQVEHKFLRHYTMWDFFFFPEKKIDKVSKNIKQRRIKITENNLPISRSLKDFFFFGHFHFWFIAVFQFKLFFFPHVPISYASINRKKKKRGPYWTHTKTGYYWYLFLSPFYLWGRFFSSSYYFFRLKTWTLRPSTSHASLFNKQNLLEQNWEKQMKRATKSCAAWRWRK